MSKRIKTMNYKISHPTKIIKGEITLTASKSESNRVLIIKALCSEFFKINNLAKAEDTVSFINCLEKSKDVSVQVFDIGAAGTAMRFLTAYFATLPGERILTGTDRMKKRPIAILVKALRELGADIEYMEEEGYPPLKIKGKPLNGGMVEMDGSVSSQFISALLLISPALKNGLVIKFKDEVTSVPYINMTLNMMQEFRVYGQWHEDSISVSKQNYHVKHEADYVYEVEADWSSASYWYSMAVLAEEADIIIKGLKDSSLQGDSVIADLFTFFGVKTEFMDDGIRLTKIKYCVQQFGFNFADCPDIAQTVAVVVTALKIPSFFSGLYTLAIKETDRLLALGNELKELKGKVDIINNSIKLESEFSPEESIQIETYDDHRMAMAFAPLALKTNSLIIKNPSVVKKSYPDFWTDFKKVGFVIEEV